MLLSSVALLFSAFESASAPLAPIWFNCKLQREKRVRNARSETGPPAQSRARATYSRYVSVVLLLSASESAVAPSSPLET